MYIVLHKFEMQTIELTAIYQYVINIIFFPAKQFGPLPLLIKSRNDAPTQKSSETDWCIYVRRRWLRCGNVALAGLITVLLRTSSFSTLKTVKTYIHTKFRRCMYIL